jgi:hypothetical protein
MKNSALRDQIVGRAETPYQETRRLRAEITMRQARVELLRQEAERGLIEIGLKRMGRKRVKLQIKQLNHICATGYFDTREWTSKEFGFESHHGSVAADMGNGIQCMVSINDTWLEVHVSWKLSKKEDQKPGSHKILHDRLPQNLAKTRQFLRRFGVVVDCDPILSEALTKAQELTEMAHAIHQFKGHKTSLVAARQAVRLRATILRVGKLEPKKPTAHEVAQAMS